MRTKAEILKRIKDIEEVLVLDGISNETYQFNLGKLKALNWVLNHD